MSIRTPHQVAFHRWYTSDLERLTALWHEPEYGDHDVVLHLRQYYPCLIATISRERASVAVEWDFGTWDTLYAEAIELDQDECGNWECKLRPTAHRKAGLIIEYAWENFLYEPLAAFVEREVLASPYLHLCEQGAIRWAKLSVRQDTPADALVTLHAGSAAERPRRFISEPYRH